MKASRGGFRAAHHVAGRKDRLMNGKIALALLISVGGLAAYRYHSARDDKVVIVDGWWSKDYAKSACTLALPKTAEEQSACALGDPDYGYGAAPFLQGVASSMTTDPNCVGVTVSYFWSPKSTSKETLAREEKPHKALIVDYVPGYDQQNWDLDGAGGRGTPKEIAADVCFAMSGKGARIAPW
jgi:hypothetical protein